MPSYRDVLSQPPYGLYNDEGRLTASVRAKSKKAAAKQFLKLSKKQRQGGHIVRRIR